MKSLCFLLFFSFWVSALAARIVGPDVSVNNLQHRADWEADTEQDAELDYTPAELKRNALLQKLGLPTELPRGARGMGVEDMRPFDSSRGSDLCVPPSLNRIFTSAQLAPNFCCVASLRGVTLVCTRNPSLVHCLATWTATRLWTRKRMPLYMRSSLVGRSWRLG